MILLFTGLSSFVYLSIHQSKWIIKRALLDIISIEEVSLSKIDIKYLKFQYASMLVIEYFAITYIHIIWYCILTYTLVNFWNWLNITNSIGIDLIISSIYLVKVIAFYRICFSRFLLSTTNVTKAKSKHLGTSGNITNSSPPLF